MIELRADYGLKIVSKGPDAVTLLDTSINPITYELEIIKGLGEFVGKAFVTIYNLDAIIRNKLQNVYNKFNLIYQNHIDNMYKSNKLSTLYIIITNLETNSILYRGNIINTNSFYTPAATYQTTITSIIGEELLIRPGLDFEEGSITYENMLKEVIKQSGYPTQIIEPFKTCSFKKNNKIAQSFHMGNRTVIEFLKEIFAGCNPSPSVFISISNKLFIIGGGINPKSPVFKYDEFDIIDNAEYNILGASVSVKLNPAVDLFNGFIITTNELGIKNRSYFNRIPEILKNTNIFITEIKHTVHNNPDKKNLGKTYLKGSFYYGQS